MIHQPASWFQLAQERKRAAKKEKMEAGSSTADPLGFDPTASTHELAGAGDDSKQENKASGGDGPEGLMQQGFAWQPNARVMETYDSLGIPLLASVLSKDPQVSPPCFTRPGRDPLQYLRPSRQPCLVVPAA